MLAHAGRIEASANQIRYVRFFDDFAVQPLTNDWEDTTQAGYIEDKVYVVQTISRLIERCLLMTTDPGDLVLDPTCGSGTTAFVAEQWGRRWITIDTSRVALALARTRLMAAKYPYYYLTDDYPQIAQMNADEEEIKSYLRKSAKSVDHSSGDIRKGFVYKRVPHVTLKSIANNPDIPVLSAIEGKEGMTREQIDTAIARHAELEDDAMRNRLLRWLHAAVRITLNPKANLWEVKDFPANPNTVKAALESVKTYTHHPATTTSAS